MTIKNLVAAGKMVSEVNVIKRASSINVGFYNHLKQRDEIQLDIAHHPLTRDGIEELSSLFNSLVNELDTHCNAVVDITIVATADTLEELKTKSY